MSQETQIGANIITKAVELDKKKRYTEALVCYQEGLNILMSVLKNLTNVDQKTSLRDKITNYMNRAEQIKVHVESEKDKSTYHEQIIIENDSTGHSYSNIFCRFLDELVETVEVRDPYIRVFHQSQNLLRFCELLVKHCKNLRCVQLVTTEHNDEQKKWLKQLQDELRNRFNIKFAISYSPTLHDREITLDNGWIVKIGRGLDYFKPSETKFSLGTYDLDLRKCHETIVDIFHNKSTKRSYG